MDYISILIHKYPFSVIFFSFFVGWYIMPYILKISKKKNMIVHPNHRTSHEGNIPNVGGICTVSAFLITFLISNLFFDFKISTYLFLAGLYIIFLVGFFDDILEFTPMQKINGELLAAFILIVLANVRFTNLYGIFGIYELNGLWGGILSYGISFFAFLLILNAINLIDGVDGLATGIGIEACLFLALYFQMTGNICESVIAYLTIGSLAIFFIYNVFGNKSKIFMGDSGSLAIGYVIYMLICRFCEEGTSIAAPAISIGILAVPLFDVVRVIITRLKQHRPPFEADRNHVHHLLLSLGMKHRNVTFVLIAVNTTFILFSVIFRHWSNLLIIGTSAAMAICYTMFLWRIVVKHQNKQTINSDKNEKQD
ncbi:MAG: undecaprenyl/decaprenyl-phosphate alpha-N-acetylglucosaminyl 1-phosphate transferase [Bacteroidales bacterium]|nr:undecaprenyl/decaprenyl-phosphate alpha-N-acetylglucosaminyl 1-phosphate transferase [Bacteroidales bacterium]